MADNAPFSAPTTRLEALSDGVFSIAMTLLVINIQVPHPADGTASALITELVKQWPVYLGYFVSFVLIGGTWANHHQMFLYIERTDHVLMTVNNLMLLFVAIIPFPTAMLTQFTANPQQEQIAAVVYGAIWFIGGIFFNLIWWRARTAKLTRDDLKPEAAARFTRRYLVGPLTYFTAMIVSLFSLPLGIILYLLPSIFFLFPDRSAQPVE